MQDGQRKANAFGKDAGRHPQGQFGVESDTPEQGGASESIRDHGNGITSVSEESPGGAQGSASAGSAGGTGTTRTTGETGTTGRASRSEPNQAATENRK